MVLLGWCRKNWLRVAVHAGSLLPLLWTAWQYWQGLFLVDPVQEITARTGRTALILLLLSLACTPISTLTGLKQVVKVRRALGMYAALYVAMHFLTFVGLDYRLNLDLLPRAILDQRYVLAGSAAGLLLLPLVLTSTRGWQRRLGKNWKRLHRLVYPASILAVIHFLWLVKDSTEPLRFGSVLVLLLALRLPPVRRVLSTLRHRLGTQWKALRIHHPSGKSRDDGVPRRRHTDRCHATGEPCRDVSSRDYGVACGDKMW